MSPDSAPQSGKERMTAAASPAEPSPVGRVTPPDTGLRAILRLASPIFVANLAIMGGAIIDTVMAGRLGS